MDDGGEAAVGRLMEASRSGDPAALDRLFEVVYGDLRARAHAQRRRWHGQETLNTTALIHETYIKLAGAGADDWESRAHFLAIASRAMRQVLVDYARRQGAAKRGGEWRPVSLDEILLDPERSVAGGRSEAVLALEASLASLEEANPRHGRIVECRFFGGMTIGDTAEALGLSPATVKRGWAVAQAWLYRDIRSRLRNSEGQ
ncbi:MAG: ECF-type sigma factor [Candidatus Palauibacterales bacterium]|nr:ECF-type sigma factor [Candidatus Palauibacterales bacterium]MDP2530390.1 ECF-type sigma factor [Candidatus Palauibacterales bacterium]MDP2585076.1 ECF-type sigma factor [Candidatus Palauibacterales bacterium]